jgi:hypothetical protein
MCRRKKVVGIISLILFLALLSFPPILKVKGIENPHYIVGYVWNSTGAPLAYATVVLVDVNNGNGTAVGTSGTGYYQADVSLIEGSADGDTIEVSVSVGEEGGDNYTIIDIALGSQWCNVTTAPKTISISVTPSTWSQGSLYLGTVNSTTGNYFNLTNQGNIAVNILIHGENITWDSITWYINDTADKDKFAFQYKKSIDSEWSTIRYNNSTFIEGINDDYYPGIDNQAAKNYITFDLKFFLPTSSTKEPPPLSTNITFWAVDPS